MCGRTSARASAWSRQMRLPDEVRAPPARARRKDPEPSLDSPVLVACGAGRWSLSVRAPAGRRRYVAIDAGRDVRGGRPARRIPRLDSSLSK